MKIIAKTNNKPCTILIKIAVQTPQKIYLKVKDAERPNTNFTSRYCNIESEETFHVRMPLSAEKCEIILANEAELNGGKGDNYKVVDLKMLPLKRKLTAFNHANGTIRRFVRFAQEFSKKAGYISANGSIYASNDNQFRIDYLDDIKDETGKSLKTPARISRSQGIIEVSREKFVQYTVPMRVAILLHEFSHYYLNTDMANETEADLNALLIYLGLGYPKIDAYNVFIQVFSTSANEVNTNRMKIIDDFIQGFEKKHFEMNYDEHSLYKNY